MLYHILGGICCAVVALANLIPTNMHFDQSPLFSDPTIVNGNLRYRPNSNICETTPGVNQKSDYVTMGQNMPMVNCGGVSISLYDMFFHSGFGSLNHTQTQKRHPRASRFGFLFLS